MLKHEKKNYYHDKLEKVANNSRNTWKVLNYVLHLNKQAKKGTDSEEINDANVTHKNDVWPYQVTFL